MFKKITKYNYKTLAMLGLMGMGACGLQSCGEDPIVEDINATKLEALRQDSTVQAQAVRNAIEPAKKSPEDISLTVDDFFKVEENKLGMKAKTLEDSAKVLTNTVIALRSQYGNPIPKNNETLTALETKGNTYLATIAEINELNAQNQK